MPVFKNKTQGQYVNVYKDILKNHSLSLRDRGMVVTLLSLPDNWEFTISGLSKIIPDGKSSIRASLTHLEELGYISRMQERAECGKFGKIAIEPCQIFSTIIPSQPGRMLSLEECLRPLHAFYLEKKAELSV